ncbi:MAG: hypothetical protein HETSPECPRED_005195 [Heterodermia speciosa]|uniref:Oxidoreductase AflY n=1 Tax=Heterodermia speciosa TaxID=116794 RepID=A0A8H3FFW8_9LECA|nr:MAG: hypothetical protein HETSPECPRED_005195 [Heterodermia speciosa]
MSFESDSILELHHIVHHVLTLYALGASPEQIQSHYNNNKSYQRPPQPLDDKVVQDLNDYKKFQQYLGNEKYYHDYLVFFGREIDKKGYEKVINEYLLKGFLHPIIHLGFALEFNQPALVAEALAQAAAHDTYMSKFFLPAEKAAATEERSKSLVELLDEIRADQKLSTAAHWNDGNKIRDGILIRAPDEMITYASQYKVSENELEEKTAEMTNAAVYFTGGAQHPPKQVKIDFYYMHCVNCSIFFSVFLKAPWISDKNKVRLLEWKGRNDLALYASRRSPKPLLDEIQNYKPVKPQQSSWDAVIERMISHEDDGHGIKLVRAIRHGQEICKPYDGKPSFRVRNGMWDKLGNIAIDSVENSGDTWVRSAGFDEAWENFEDRPRAQL